MEEYNFREVNFAHITGKIGQPFTFSHSQEEKRFYKSVIDVPRYSGVEDHIPIIADSDKLPANQNLEGQFIELRGRFCSFAKYTEDRKKTVERYIFVQELKIDNNEENMESLIGTNEIFLDGKLRFDPIYRRTPKGRIIAEFTLLSKRRNHPDRIPCVAWGENAMTLSQLSAKTRIQICGRLQSREYQKTIEDETITKIFHEVSVSDYTVVNSAEEA